MIFRIEETALHHSVYEVEADPKEDALAKLRDNYGDLMVEEFWGDVSQDVTEKPVNA